jgi:hypothetical protein
LSVKKSKDENEEKKKRIKLIENKPPNSTPYFAWV